VGEKELAKLLESRTRRHRAADRVAACLLALGVLAFVAHVVAGALGYPPPFWPQVAWWVFWPVAWALLIGWRDRPLRGRRA
jgi:fatty acid desaturase